MEERMYERDEVEGVTDGENEDDDCDEVICVG